MKMHPICRIAALLLAVGLAGCSEKKEESAPGKASAPGKGCRADQGPRAGPERRADPGRKNGKHK